MMRANLQTDAWEAAVRELQSHGKKKLDKVMEESARLVMRDVIAFTPPFGNAPVTEANKEKRDIGKAAVARDILKIYAPIKKLSIWKRRDALGKRVKHLAATNPSMCRDLLNAKGYPCHAVTTTFSKKFHREARDKRGRVKWRQSKGKVFVVNFGEVTKYIQQQQKRVGTAMSGWAWGVRKLKVKRLAKWMTDKRSKSRGSVKLKKSRFPDWSLVVQNQVKHAQKHVSLRPVQRAIKNQIRNLKKRTEAAIASAARKAER